MKEKGMREAGTKAESGRFGHINDERLKSRSNVNATNLFEVYVRPLSVEPNSDRLEFIFDDSSVNVRFRCV